jgi:hypothetical protein
MFEYNEIFLNISYNNGDLIGGCMKKIIKGLTLAISVWSLSSCITVGRSFNSDISWIVKDETKQKDVVLVLGGPQEVGSSGGVPTWTYYYYHYKAVGPDTRKEVKFYWNQDQTVNHFSFTSSASDDINQAEAKANM